MSNMVFCDIETDGLNPSVIWCAVCLHNGESEVICNRTVYVKKINLDDCTHLVYCSESASTYFMGTKQECELYQLNHDLDQYSLRVEVA